MMMMIMIMMMMIIINIIKTRIILSLNFRIYNCVQLTYIYLGLR
jgi:hypothetical protein